MTNRPDRRPTPLAGKLAAEIRTQGPIAIDRYMELCLADPEHGYYRSRSGIGAQGDFTTAPEMSQVFGELIGLWAVVVWQQMGAPQRFNLVELGPGRGVLMADALRAARVLPGFLAAVDLHLVEINPAFRSQQAEQLAPTGVKASWHDGWPQLEPFPTIVIANEFLDTLPGVQAELLAPGIWRERRVGLDNDGELVFVVGNKCPPMAMPQLPSAPVGSTYTHVDFRTCIGPIAASSRKAPLAALFIDYGHDTTSCGDTLQAVRNHVSEHPLTSPGEADLSFAVDFQAFQHCAEALSLQVDGPISQAQFLGQLGITERASRLMAANPRRTNDIESGIARLLAIPGMGNRFLAIGLRSAKLEPLPGFAMPSP